MSEIVKEAKKMIDAARKAVAVNLASAYQAIESDDSTDALRQTEKATKNATLYLMAVSNLFRNIRGITPISEALIRDLLMTTATGEPQGLVTTQTQLGVDPTTGEISVTEPQGHDPEQQKMYEGILSLVKTAHTIPPPDVREIEGDANVDAEEGDTR